MKIPKILENVVLNSDNVKKEVADGVRNAIKAERKDWALETAKAIDARVGKRKKFIVSSSQKGIWAKEYSPGKNFTTLSIVYSDAPGSIQCSNRIRDAVIGGGFVIKPVEGKTGTKKELKQLIDFFDSPNSDDTIETLIGSGIGALLAYGNWYIEKVPTKGTANRRKKEIAQLYNLNSTRVKLLVDASKKKQGILTKVGYQRLTAENKKINYALDEVCHIKLPDYKAGLYGRAILEDNLSNTQLLLRAITYNISILRNGGRPPLQIILPDDSNEADADAVNAYFEKNFMGAENAGKTMVTFKGAKIDTLGVTPEEMSYLSLLNFGLKLVAGQYGVPLILIGFPEGTNRATASEARRSFYYTNIYPLRRLITNKLNREIVINGLGITGWKIDFRSAGLEESEATRRDTQAGFSKGLYKYNEARIKMGLLPIDKPWANEAYLLSSKNDALTPVEDAIGATPNVSAPDSKKPENTPSRGQGEGADSSSK